MFSRQPWIWLSLLLLISLLAATQLGKLQERVSADEMLVVDDPQRAYYEQVREIFGEDQIVLLVLEDPEPLDADKLSVLQDVVQVLEALPFVDRVESLFSAPHVKSVEGFLDKAPYLATLPETPDAAAELMEQALKNPLIRNLLVSPSGQAMAVAIVLKDSAGADRDDRISSAVARVIQPLQTTYQRAYPIGFAQVRNEIAERIMAEQKALMPLAVGALLIALFLLLRQLIDILTRSVHDAAEAYPQG